MRIPLQQAAGAALALALYANAVEPNWLRVRHRVLHLDGWDPSLDGVRLLHLSDLHIGHDTQRLTRFLRRSSRLEADVAVITGDFLGGPKGVPLLEGVLGELTRRHKVVGILGNHEHRYHTRHLPRNGRWRTRHYVDSAEIMDSLADAGVTMLRNSAHTLSLRGASLTFAGIDDLLGGHDDWDATLAGVSDPYSTVLLSHTPDAHERAASHGFPLVLSGHTHGGQVRVGPWLTPTTGTIQPLERPSGLIKRGRTLLHISPGLATTVVPFRFFARPELTLLELRSAA